MSWNEIALKHRADKASSWHDYMPSYERHLSGRDIRSMMEIGVGAGESIRMWMELFPNAKIHGLDIDRRALKQGNSRVEIFLVDQGNREQLTAYAATAPRFDFIVDDGSHLHHDAITSLQVLFSSLNAGGLYVIEDMHCNRYDEHMKTPADFAAMRAEWSAGFWLDLIDLIEFIVAHASEIKTVQVTRSKHDIGETHGQCLILIQKI